MIRHPGKVTPGQCRQPHKERESRKSRHCQRCRASSRNQDLVQECRWCTRQMDGGCGFA